MNKRLKFLCRIIICLIGGMACGSCKQKIYTRADLVDYVNDPNNGLRQTKNAGGIQVGLLFQPWQVIMEHKTEAKGSPLSDTLKKRYHFILRFSYHNKELLRQLPFDKYSEMVQVMSFRMTDYISIITDSGESTAPLGCFLQQTYGMSNANELLVAFDKRKLEHAKKMKLLVKEFGLNLGDLAY